MAGKFKKGQRVVVLPLPSSHPLAYRSGLKGEIDAIDGERYLVDNQLVEGVRQGMLDMRDWFHESELEHG